MPFVLQSDDALVAQVARALRAEGVHVVVDRTSSMDECVGTAMRRDVQCVVIATSPTAVQEAVAMDGEQPAWGYAVLMANTVPLTNTHMASSRVPWCLLLRNREFLDAGAGAVAWWRKVCEEPKWCLAGVGFTCALCRKKQRDAPINAPCPQCHAAFCDPCIERASNPPPCPQCGTWYLKPFFSHWGVPWDTPRPRGAPSRRPPAAAPSALLPARMAAAVGPDRDWLRLPPQHQRMHPVDVLVDGVLAVLDGRFVVRPSLPNRKCAPGDEVLFSRENMTDRLYDANGQLAAPQHLDEVRRRLKLSVGRLMAQVRPLPLQEVDVQVRRRVVRVHPTANAMVWEAALFTVRVRERGATGGGGAAGPAVGAHEWELVQVGPRHWVPIDLVAEGVQVAYLPPVRYEPASAIQQVLRDAHARLGGTACGSKLVMFLHGGGGGGSAAAGPPQFLSMPLGRQGARLDALHSGWAVWERARGRSASSVLRQARLAGRALYAACRDVEAVGRMGLPGPAPADGSRWEGAKLEGRVWALEGLVWQQRQQRQSSERGSACGGWERRGGAGRRGRRPREPGVAFALDPRGEARRAATHEEAARVLAQAMVAWVGP